MGLTTAVEALLLRLGDWKPLWTAVGLRAGLPLAASISTAWPMGISCCAATWGTGGMSSSGTSRGMLFALLAGLGRLPEKPRLAGSRRTSERGDAEPFLSEPSSRE